MNTTKIKPLSELCVELGITAKVKELNSHNNKGGLTKFPEWAKQGWSITLKYNKKRSQFRFYGGGAVDTPTASDLIYSLIMDKEALNQDFGDWCSEFGYDTFNIKARSTYKACKANGERFVNLIGNGEVVNQLTESARVY